MITIHTEQKCEGSKCLGPRIYLVLLITDQMRQFHSQVNSWAAGRSCLPVVSLLQMSPPCLPLKLAAYALQQDMVTVTIEHCSMVWAQLKDYCSMVWARLKDCVGEGLSNTEGGNMTENTKSYKCYKC